MATRPFWVLAVFFALTACGDDTMNPSKPDAQPSKDATADGANKDGGDRGHADAHADAGGDVRQTEGDAGEDGAGEAVATD